MYGMLLELYNSEFAHIAKFLRHHGREGSKVFSKRCEKVIVAIRAFMSDNFSGFRKEDGGKTQKISSWNRAGRYRSETVVNPERRDERRWKN